MDTGAGTRDGASLPVSRRVMNLAQFVTQSAQRFPDRTALIWGERRWSWAEFNARVSVMAAVLADHGVGFGDRVVVQSKNSNLMLESMWACFRIGAVWAPTNFRLLPDDVAYLATASGARALLCGGEFPDHAAAVAKAMPGLALVARMGPGLLDAPDLDALMMAHAGDDHQPAAAVEYDHPCWFISTSGTTGRPKLAVLTHGQMAFIVTNHLADLLPGTTENDCCLVVAPLSHGAGNHGLTQVARGATTVLLPTERFDPGEVWRLVAEHRVTNMFAVPTIVKLLVEHPSVDVHDHSSLRRVVYAGAPMYRTDQKRALAKLGPVLVQYFGLSEVTGCITVLPPALHVLDDANARAGTCGIARTGVDIQVQDPETGAALPSSTTGEICVCGLAVFAGYYDNPEANAKAFRNGWFRTGDLGHLDAEGFLFITGRASDMYISGGSNVYPREIEEVLLTHPEILEVAVLGVPDTVWGEIGVAVAVLRPEGALDEAGLLAWLEGRVARYKQPRRAFFLPELAKSGYGKVSKVTIRQELISRGCIAAVLDKVGA